jgi:hypothetical protein
MHVWMCKLRQTTTESANVNGGSVFAQPGIDGLLGRCFNSLVQILDNRIDGFEPN